MMTLFKKYSQLLITQWSGSYIILVYVIYIYYILLYIWFLLLPPLILLFGYLILQGVGEAKGQW